MPVCASYGYLGFCDCWILGKKKQALPKGRNNVPHSGGFRVRNLMVELADFKKNISPQ